MRSLTKGVQLEGKGVDPDVLVDQGALEYRCGKDAILERGASVLVHEIENPRVRHRWL